MEEENEMASSLNRRRKKPSLGFACCFNNHQCRNSLDMSSSSASSPSGGTASFPSPRRISSPSSWIQSKGRYKNFISKMGRDHRRHSSADFSYDPLSYALNFEEHDDQDPHRPSDGEDLYKSFTSRLPLSPTRIKPASSSSAPMPVRILKSLGNDHEVSTPSPRRNVKVGFDLETRRKSPEVVVGGRVNIDQSRRSIVKSTTKPRVEAVADVRRSLESVTPCVVAQAALV